MNITSLSIFVADIIVEPTPPPILRNVEGSSGSLASLAFWAMAVVAAWFLWRMRRRRALVEERAISNPAPASPK